MTFVLAWGRCTVMLVAGALSPHLDDTVNMNGRMDPTTSSWMKISDCGMVLEEQPGKVSEAFRLFLQGLGYGKLKKKKKRGFDPFCFCAL
uniref:Secreted protein n=1 Tax=Ixodes ricinus TaxID=34613 RepID=A0A6B0U0S8_IXORI